MTHRGRGGAFSFPPHGIVKLIPRGKLIPGAHAQGEDKMRLMPTRFLNRIESLENTPPGGGSVDLVTEEMNAGNKNLGVPGAYQPGDLKKLDELLPGDIPGQTPEPGQEPIQQGTQPGQPSAPGTTEDQTLQVSPEALVAIEQKVKSGTELTPEEKQVVDDMKAAAAAPAGQPAAPGTQPAAPAGLETQIYKIGKQVFTFAQIEAKIRAEGKLGNVDLSPAARKFIVDNYVGAQNRTEATRALNDRQQAVASQAKINVQEAARLAQERARQEEIGRSIGREVSEFLAQKEHLQSVAGKGIKREDFMDGDGRVTDFDKQFDYFEQERARRDLAALGTREQTLSRENDAQQARLHLAVMKEFQANHAELKTKDSLVVIAGKMKRNEPVDDADRLKLMRIVEMYDIADDKGWSIDDVYRLRTTQPDGSSGPGAQPSGEELDLPNLPAQSQDLLKIIEDYKRAQARSAGGPGGGVAGSPRAGASHLTPAQQIIASDRAHRGDNSADDFLKEIKY